MATGRVEAAARAANPNIEHTLAKFGRDQLKGFIQAAIDLLDAADGDYDLEDDNEDMCCARDETGGRHSNDSYGDGLPGDPADAEPGDEVMA